MTERGDAVLLTARGRGDVWLEFTVPVQVQRPLHEPLATRRLAIASDEPDRLVTLLVAGMAMRPAGELHTDRAARGLLSALDLTAAAGDAAQPA